MEVMAVEDHGPDRSGAGLYREVGRQMVVVVWQGGEKVCVVVELDVQKMSSGELAGLPSRKGVASGCLHMH